MGIALEDMKFIILSKNLVGWPTIGLIFTDNNMRLDLNN